MMFCYCVFNMDIVYLPLDRLSQGLVRSSDDWSSSDSPYFSYDLFGIIPIFFLMVIGGLLICSLTILIIFLHKLLKLSSLDQLLYMLFQILALVYVVIMIFMETAVFLYISLF